MTLYVSDKPIEFEGIKVLRETKLAIHTLNLQRSVSFTGVSETEQKLKVELFQNSIAIERDFKHLVLLVLPITR